MQAYELQALLRRAEPLQNIEVCYESDLRRSLAPHLVHVKGVVSLYGELRQFETEVDLTGFRSEFDVYRLAKALMQSFEDAAKEIAKGVVQ
jgi:hypothetical protein